MAITNSVLMGVPTTMAQNVVFALPPVTVQLLGTAAVEVSVDNSTWVALTNSATASGAATSACFVRCTTGASVIVCERLS